MVPNGTLTPHRGVLVLVLGIVSLVACQLLGVVPWVLANNDLKEMDAGRMDPDGRGLTQAGKILGIISIVVAVIGILLTIGMFVLGIDIAATGAAAGR